MHVVIIGDMDFVVFGGCGGWVFEFEFFLQGIKFL